MNQEEPIKKETLGQQIIRHAAMEPEKQGVRETTLAMGESYMREFEACVKKHLHVKQPYFIQAIIRKDMQLENAVHITMAARYSRPNGTWNCSLYEIDNNSNTVKHLWTLPHEEEARQVVKRPDLFDVKFVEDCRKMLKGEEL